MLQDKYMQAQQQHAQALMGQRDGGSIQDPFETINETQTASITDDWQSTQGHGDKNFATIPVPTDIRATTRNQRTARTVGGRNAHSSQTKAATLQVPEASERGHTRRVSQEGTHRSSRASRRDGLGQPLVPADPQQEVMALRQNPNTKRFQNFMSRVITSVRTRTQNNRLDQSDAQVNQSQV